MKIENLYFSYGENQVIRNLSLNIEGKITALTGPSGCGKTTLLRLMAGLETPEGGEITQNGERIYLMFQEDRLFPWMNVLENVAVVSDNNNLKTAKELLCAVELENYFYSYPRELSGGMKRRVALARVLMLKADLLLLDEPFKGMDYALVKKMAELVKAQQAQIIISTHSEEEISLLGADVVDLASMSE